MAKYYLLTDYLIHGAPQNGVQYEGSEEIGVSFDLAAGKNIENIEVEDITASPEEIEYLEHDDEDYGHPPLGLDDKLAWYKEKNLPLPKARVLASFDSVTLSVVFYNVDEGRFILRADRREDAYRVAYAIRGFFSLFHGWHHQAGKAGYFLLELRKKPMQNWSLMQLMANLGSVNAGYAEADIRYLIDINTDRVVEEDQFEPMVEFVGMIYGRDGMTDAVNGLQNSRMVLNGYMSAEEYKYQYLPDRKSIKQPELEKMFLEYGFLMHTSFMAAYRGICAIFRTNAIAPGMGEELLRKASIPATVDKEYKRMFEGYTSYPKKETYANMLEHFGMLADILSGSLEPEEGFLLTQDSVFEAQLFLGELITRVTGFYEYYEEMFYRIENRRI